MAAQNNFEEDEMITGINITPMVDIMLVLLIIFMVTSNYIVNKSIKVNLPEASAKSDVQQNKTLRFAIDQNSNLYLDGVPMEFELISQAIHERQDAQQNSKLSALISADKTVSHGIVVRLIDAIRKGGISEFSIDVKEPLK